MTKGTTDRIWQDEARTQQTKRLIRDIKRITRRKFTAQEKIRIVLEGFRQVTRIFAYLLKYWMPRTLTGK